MSDWQEERLTVNLFTPIWTFMDTSVTVTSRDGASIQHGVVNSKQGYFLDAPQAISLEIGSRSYPARIRLVDEGRPN